MNHSRRITVGLRALALVITLCILLLGLVASGIRGSDQSARPRGQWIHCEAPFENAVADRSGKVLGKIGPTGRPTWGRVWLEPADFLRVFDSDWFYENLLPIDEPVELKTCKGHWLGIKYHPLC